MISRQTDRHAAIDYDRLSIELYGEYELISDAWVQMVKSNDRQTDRQTERLTVRSRGNSRFVQTAALWLPHQNHIKPQGMLHQPYSCYGEHSATCISILLKLTQLDYGATVAALPASFLL